jgi:hypothetical protein
MNDVYNFTNEYSLEGILQCLNRELSTMKFRDAEMMKEKSA